MYQLHILNKFWGLKQTKRSLTGRRGATAANRENSSRILSFQTHNSTETIQ